MADCSKDEIPEELITRKGSFKCRGTHTSEGFDTYYGCQFPTTIGVEYEPTDGDIIAEGPSTVNHSASPAIQAMIDTLGDFIRLKNVAYEDEYMSWMSDPITIPDAPINEQRRRNGSFGGCECCGKFGLQPDEGSDAVSFYPTNKPPVKCPIVGEYDAWSFGGQSVNVSWWGATLQYVVNLYKVYCCTVNDDDEIIDYDYAYNLISTYIKDGKTYVGSQLLYNYGAGLGNCFFCAINLTGGYPVQYPATSVEIYAPPLMGRIHIPLKVKEF